ncbi:hypothetical protein [Kitasatospora viridis]|uniref:Uncharacterized protein n=1 Tax=Kitasatospora viridis TaxID=281105 RepID=A0A561UF45_9ACTN|nr:hypothetical protein [Kitasatospora viridis]TWF97999.1 hypothetical protein FHX73_111801 [Kitasatospora viridis]
MNPSTIATVLAFTGLVSGIGVLGHLVGRDVDRAARQGRDNWHRPTGYPTDPARSDRLHTTDPDPVPPAPADPGRLRGTLPAASDLRLGTLARWTSSSGPRPKPISTPRVR